MERLVEVFPFMDDLVALDCADLLLRVTFYEKGFQFHFRIYGDVEPMLFPTFADLEPVQQHILQLLAAKEMLWRRESFWMLPPGWPRGSDRVHMEALAHLRLPSTLQELQAFIALKARQ